jgi:hypothetical protein
MSTPLPDDLFIAATGASPEVDFRYSNGTLSLKGESYPENAAAFYAEPIARTRAYLGALGAGKSITVDVAMAYFNSSSTKMLFGLFNAFNAAAEAGTHVILNWRHDADDDTILEFGNELHDEFPALDYHAIATDG